ncbi:MAG TPA: SPOR domain-containing protein [Rhizomicrobium sp.]|nr:SPOR domain-containing protein [Rhizomicrobium sp.]
MPSFERGVYEPKSDDVRVFDEDDQEIDEEGSRLPLLIVIALLVLAAFGGVVWLAYSQGVQRGRADAPRMIVAAPGPVKEAAADGSDTTHSLKIYQQPAPEDDTSDNESVPPPPTAVEKPAPAPVTSKPAPVAATPAAKPVAMAQAPAAKPAEKPAAAAAKPVEAKPVPAVSQPASKPVEVAALPPPSAAKPTETMPAPAGSYVLQIGAYKSQEDADAAWKAFKGKHPMASAYSEDVRKADLGDKGIWYRLRMGSFADKSAAASFCEKLKADGGSCLVSK